MMNQNNISLENVVKGLECCLSASLGETICPTCMYRYDENGIETGDCEINLLKDAIALLKAQEPRVLTLREWISTPEPADGECMCYEIKNKGLQAMLVKAFDGVRHLYGKAFRVWTSRPDKATMEATPWE